MTARTLAAVVLALPLGVTLAAAPPAPPAKPAAAKSPAVAPTPSTPALHGSVAGPDGKVIAGARVRVVPELDRPSGRRARRSAPVVAKTAEDGTFSIAGLEGERFRLRVEAEGLAPLTQGGIPAGASVKVKLLAGQSLAGRVRDLRTGEPVAGATVRVCDPGAEDFGREACRHTTSRDDGGFRFDDLPRGAGVLEAVAAGHALERRDDLSIPWKGRAGEPEKLEIFLGPGARLAGRVLETGDRPVEDAELTLWPLEQRLRDLRRRAPDSETTDASGHFEFEGVPAGDRYRLRVSKQEYAPGEAGPFALEAGVDRTDLVVRLGRGATLTGRLVDRDEHPATVAGVDLLPTEGRRSPAGRRPFGPGARAEGADVEHGENGRFVVRHFQPGSYTVRIVPEDAADIERNDVHLREGETTDLGTLVARQGLAISGTITDLTGQPVAGATIRALWQDEGRFRSREARSDAAGRYRVAGLGEVPVQRLWVTASGFTPGERDDVRPGDEAVDITLEPAGSVVGRVVLSGGQVPPSFEIQTHREAGDDAPAATTRGRGRMRFADRAESHSFSDPAGNFRIDDLEPGTLTLEARAHGMAPGRKTGVQVVSGRVTDAGTLVLERGATLRGRVLAARDDTPVAGATVEVAAPQGLRFWAGPAGAGSVAVSGADGSFVIEGLEPGAHAVAVEHPDYSRADARVEVPADGDPAEMVVHLSAGGTLTGTVRDAQGQPVMDARIMLMTGRFGSDGRFASTDADGRYLIERLAPGTYGVARMPDGGFRAAGMGTKSATIREGETTVVDFDEQPRISVGGHVLRGDEPLAGAMLIFMLRGGTAEGPPVMKTTRSEADGTYRIALDEAGTYEVMIRAGGSPGFGGGRSVELTVPDEPEVTHDIVLTLTGIAGTVTDREGAPVAGAIVTVRLEGGVGDETGGRSGAQTRPDGGYGVDGLDPGTYRVSVSAPGFSYAEKYPLEVVEGGGVTTVDFRLDPGRTLRGRVVDPEGRGVSGALVFVTPSGTPAGGSLPTSTDVNGAFRVTAPAEGPLDVAVSAPGWAPAWRTGVIADDDQEIVIPVSAGGGIEIRVVGADGQPVSGAQVAARSLDVLSQGGFGGGGNLRQARPTGFDGATRFDLLAPGSYEILVVGRQDVTPVQVHVEEGAVASVVLRLS